MINMSMIKTTKIDRSTIYKSSGNILSIAPATSSPEESRSLLRSCLAGVLAGTLLLTAVPAMAAGVPRALRKGQSSAVVVSNRPVTVPPQDRNPQIVEKTASDRNIGASPANATMKKREKAVTVSKASVRKNATIRTPEPAKTAPAAAENPRDTRIFPVQNSKENRFSLLAPERTRNLDSALESMIGGTGEKVPGLGVIVYKDGKEVYRRFLGRSFISPRNPAWDQPLTADTRFRAASLSKMFTALAVMRLAERGKLDLDADASRYLGFPLRNPRYPDTVITPRMLLSHTSSVRDTEYTYIPFSRSAADLFRPGGALYGDGDAYSPAGQPPGTYFSYSNLNYILLGTMVEKITGKPFDRYMDQDVLAPLDIGGSYNIYRFTPAERQKLGTLYRKYSDGHWDQQGAYHAQVDDRPLPALSRDAAGRTRYDRYVPGTNAGLFAPQGGLRLSGEELSHFLETVLSGGSFKGRRIIGAKSLKAMETPLWNYTPATPNGTFKDDSIEAYGLALQIFPGSGLTRPLEKREVSLTGHFGEAYGFIGGVLWQPGTGNGFVFFQTGTATPESANPGLYSANYRWQEKFITAIMDNAFPDKQVKKGTDRKHRHR